MPPAPRRFMRSLRAAIPPPPRGCEPADRTRIARALEVFEATGRPISDWHREGMPPVLDPARVAKVFLAPDRAALYRRIDARFDAMLAAGALEEVRALAARRLDPLLPAMKAHGVPWLIRHLEGDISLEAAADGASATPATTPSASSPGSAISSRDWPRVDPARRVRRGHARRRPLRDEPKACPRGRRGASPAISTHHGRPQPVCEVEMGGENPPADRRRSRRRASDFRRPPSGRRIAARGPTAARGVTSPARRGGDGIR